jgi:hypothetical protein
MDGKENPMVEMTPEQVQAMEALEKGPLHLLNPKTNEVYVLIRQDVYKLTCSVVGGGSGQVWDDVADDDLIRK